MRRLFDLDSPLMSFLLKAFDCIWLSALWLVFSLPVITLGAASAAMYTAVHRCLQKEEDYLLRTFWDAFRENFKRSTLCGLVFLGLLALLVLDVIFFRSLLAEGDVFGNLYWVMLVLICILVTWGAFLAAYSARCNGTVKEVLRTSLLLMLLHPIRAFMVFLPMLFCGIMALAAPGLAILLPAPICWLGSRTIEQILRLHMQPEDLERECEHGN